MNKMLDVKGILKILSLVGVLFLVKGIINFIPSLLSAETLIYLGLGAVLISLIAKVLTPSKSLSKAFKLIGKTVGLLGILVKNLIMAIVLLVKLEKTEDFIFFWSNREFNNSHLYFEHVETKEAMIVSLPKWYTAIGSFKNKIKVYINAFKQAFVETLEK